MVAKTKKTTSSKKAPAKKTAAKKTTAAKSKTTKKVEKPASGGGRETNPLTGFVVGTDQDTIATALIEGGESRASITEGLKNTLDAETRNGTEKPVTNMVAGVLRKLLDQGFTVESSFKVNEPTPASKRKATAARNKAAAAKESKPAAKKSAAKSKTSSAKKGKAASKRK